MTEHGKKNGAKLVYPSITRITALLHSLPEFNHCTRSSVYELAETFHMKLKASPLPPKEAVYQCIEDVLGEQVSTESITEIGERLEGAIREPGMTLNRLARYL